MALNLTCYFIRHGQTNYNLQKRFQGHLPVPLTPLGFQQARRAGVLLQNLLNGSPTARSIPHKKLCAHLFTSDLKRALDTSQEIVSACQEVQFTLHLDARLREFHTGICTDFTFSEVYAQHPELIQSYLDAYERNPKETAYPGLGGESQIAVVNRFISFFNEMINAYPSPWVVCTHGGALQCFLQHAVLPAFKTKLPNRIGNGDVIEAHLTKDGWIVGRYYKNSP